MDSECARAREVCELVVSGDGQQITMRTRPGLSVEREVQAAALTALCAGVDPRKAALDQQLAILDRALAQVRGTGELLRRPT